MQVFQTLCTIGIKSFIISYTFLIHCFTLYAHLFTATCFLWQLLLELIVQTSLSSFVPAPILLLLSHSSPPLNHSSDCPKMFLTMFDNPFNDFHPTILFYTASTAGFRRYIVCIPIYPYTPILLSLSSFPPFSVYLHFNFCRYHTLKSLSSLLPFHSVFIAIDFLVF